MSEGIYYILKFENNDNGNKMKNVFTNAPNGTIFQNVPIHISDNNNVWVMWAKVWNEKEKQQYQQCKGVSISETPINNKIDIETIANGLGFKDEKITRQTVELNDFLTNVFCEYF